MRPAALLLIGVSFAQPPVAPTGERVGPARGTDASGYNIVQSFETGYRFLDLDGNRGKYRSDVNFRNGVRLLASRFSVFSKDGHGRYFDEFTVDTQGLGNDPYQFSSLRLSRNRWYNYTALWRSSEYMNPALAVSNGQHLIDTTRTLQDHDLTFLPQSSFRFFAGFSRNVQSGAGLSTLQLFDSRGDEFPLFARIHRRQNEFRVGNELRYRGMRLNWMRIWEQYKEDVPTSLTAPSPGNNPADRTTLSSLNRREPYEGSTPTWRVSLFREQGERWAFNARFTHASGRRNFVFDENAIGTDRFAQAQNRQVLAAGFGRRPVTSANATVSLFPHPRLSFTNHTAFHNTRMEGDVSFRQIDNATLSLAQLNFQHLGIRTFVNSSDVNLRVNPRLSLRGGYQYSTRSIQSVEGLSVEGFSGAARSSYSNRLHAGRFGLRLQPAKPFTLTLDSELGRADRPFSSLSDRNYHGLAARAQYKNRQLTLSALARSNYNFNSTSLLVHSARSRTVSYDAAWTPRDWFSLQAGYAKWHVDTVTGIAYFQAQRLVSGDRSFYLSNLHAGHFGARFAIRSRADLYLGYNRSQDTGGAAPASALIAPYSQFPMAFDSPQARLSLRLSSKLRWNIGYQRFAYDETLLPSQNYRAHTGFTSVLWSF